MRHKHLALLSLALLASATTGSGARAAETPKTMSKITVKVLAPKPRNEFQEQPKTYYRATRQYMRSEEALDKGINRKALMIANEPDVYMMELVSKTGKKLKDPGPTYDVILPIFGSPVKDKELAQLEYGMEREFFEKRKIAPVKDELDGKDVEKYEGTADGAVVRLWVDPKSKKPLRVSATKDGTAGAFEYLEYEPDLKFDAAMFAPPKDVKFEEKPSWLVQTGRSAPDQRKIKTPDKKE